MSGLLSEYLHRKRNAIVRQYIKGDVLDIGCGPATSAEFLDSSQRYVGVEVQQGYMRYLRREFPQHTFLQRDVDRESLLLGNLEFDTVLMLAVIEHLARPEKVIQEVRSYMKPEGHLIISTPTPVGSAIHRLGAKVGLFSHEAVVDHEHIYDGQELKRLLAKSGMRVVLYRAFEFGANQLCVATPSV